MAIEPGPQFDDFLNEHGMTPTEQFASERAAAAVPVEDFEGEYAPIEGFTWTKGPLSKVMWESRMRKSTGLGKHTVDEAKDKGLDD